MTYAGIGARYTPDDVLADMGRMAGWLAARGWHLNSGGAAGADTAFADATPVAQRTLYLPWPGANGLSGPDCRVLTDAEYAACAAIAERLHPAWERCPPGARKLHARNAGIVLSPSTEHPVNAVVCWTQDGEVVGGTGMALRIAEAYGVPIVNLATTSPREACEILLRLARS